MVPYVDAVVAVTVMRVMLFVLHVCLILIQIILQTIVSHDT